MRRVALPLVLLVLPLAAAACGGDDNAAEADVALLRGQPLLLVSGADMPADLSDARPSATFEDTSVSGSTGCNRYTGDFMVDGSSLEISGVVMTQMACPPPADAIEHAYVASLAKVAGWHGDGEEIVLVDADDAELLRYERATPEGSWQATSLQGDDALASPLAGTEITATFDTDGRVSGSSGCNTYNGTYTVDLNAIQIEDVAGTKKACAEPAGVMEQETAYLALLGRAATYTVDGKTLTLLDVDRKQLVAFAKAP
jgi:heat shock protein HslJ